MTLINRLSHSLVGETITPIQTDVIVLDVSFWQDRDDTPQKIDFQKMKSAGAKGVILRAGQNTWNDEDFEDYYRDSKGILPRGIYWFYDSRSSPVSQAIRVYELVNKLGSFEMEIWADYEERYNGQYKGWRHFSVFISEIERMLPKVKVGIYTGYYYWLENSPNPITQKANLDWFGKYPLWLAWYVSDPKFVKIPKPWDKILYWQFTDNGNGNFYGVESGNVDINYFNGSEDDFNKRYFGVEIPPIGGEIPDEEPEPTEDKVYVQIKPLVNVNLRTGNSTNYPIIITLKSGTILKSLESLEDTKYKTGRTAEWLKVSDGENIGYLSSFFVNLFDYVEPEEPEIPDIETKIAIPGPFRLLSDGDITGNPKKAFEDRFPNGKLNSYPATINLVGGKGQVQLSKSYLTQLQRINTPKQYARIFTNEHGWHNRPYGEIGRVQQLTFAHSNVWVTGEDSNYYYVDVYYNDEIAPDLVANYDKYRINIFSIMGKNDAKDNGGIFYDDTGYIKILLIANNKNEKLKIEKKFCKSLISLPIETTVKVNIGGVLNVRDEPVSGKVIDTLDNNEKITILELRKFDTKIWGRIGENKWVAVRLTHLDI